MRKYFLVLFLGLFCFLAAAHFADGELYLKINIASGNSLSFDSVDGSLQISDESGLFERSFVGKIHVSIVNPEATMLYGILNLQPEPSAGEEASIRHYFAWEDGKVVLKEELQHFFPFSFHTLEAAQDYALEYGFPFRNIRPIPISNSTLLVQDCIGQKHYYESPLSLKSSGELRVDGLLYEGGFEINVFQGKVQLNQLVSLEEYISGVLPNEIGPSSPLEALKAQAIAARSHAVSLLVYNRHNDAGYDLCNGTHCQVYKGKYLRNPQVLKAVVETAGEILYLDDRVADAVYHSSCGGKTDASSKIWKGAPLMHLGGSVCIQEAANYALDTEKGALNWLQHSILSLDMKEWEKRTVDWQRSISRADLARNLGLKYVEKMEVLERSSSGRLLKLRFKGSKEIILDGEFKIRQAFGNLPSSFFYIKGQGGKSQITLPKTIEMVGRGAGHGVGMCQVGALRRARAGETYSEILGVYYPFTSISADWIKQ
ncbi:MAG: SpoIID/LytB domain-containing protein [Candidatus Cloacimonetes bacterium]|nr:SpoIID/LytB domain-containing protein [Candidatus Cloacimonadota bacterium]